MKKAIYDSLLPFLYALVALSMMACNESKPNEETHCYLNDELGGARFSVYYIGGSESILMGDLSLSNNLCIWQFRDDSDSQNHILGQCFGYDGTGRLLINDHGLCQEESFTLRFLYCNKKESRDLRLVKRSVDDRFGPPIFSYLFESIHPKTGKKEYYQFNKE